MAISKTAKENQTNIELKTAFHKTQELVKKFSKAKLAEILGKKRQNISTRMGYGGYLLIDEAPLLLKYLAAEGVTDNDFYGELSQIVNPVRTKHELNEISLSNDNDDDDIAELKVRGEVDLSCGYGIVNYNEDVTGTCKVPRSTLKKYGANIPKTEIVYAIGDSMSPEIESGDALFVDTSQTEIINGVVYAFNYDGQTMCKRLQKIGNEIKAISKNPLYDSFLIQENLHFNIVGRVVGFMRPVL